MSRPLALVWLAIATFGAGAGVALGFVLEHALK